MTVAQFYTSPKHKLAYLTMRKSGCTSIKRAIARLRGMDLSGQKPQAIHEPHAGHMSAANIAREKGWFTFTIVREPITRFLSFYSNKILDQNVNGNPTLMDRRRYGFLPNMSLDAAIDSHINPRYPTEPHAVRQSEVLDAVNFDLDFVGKLEEVDDCLAQIKQATGADLRLEHMNQRRGKHPLINKQQFDLLAEFYRDDIQRFGYPASYDSWRKEFVDPTPEQFHSEPGFEFENEAKLLKYSTERTDRRFVIDLHWRVAETNSRTRYFRVVRNSGEAHKQVLFFLRANTDLRKDCDSNGLVHERLAFQISRLPEEYQNDDLFVQVYFWNRELQTAKIINYRGNNKLLIGLPSPPDTETATAKSAETKAK